MPKGRYARRQGVRQFHIVRWEVYESGGLKSLERLNEKRSIQRWR